MTKYYILFTKKTMVKATNVKNNLLLDLKL